MTNGPMPYHFYNNRRRGQRWPKVVGLRSPRCMDQSALLLHLAISSLTQSLVSSIYSLMCSPSWVSSFLSVPSPDTYPSNKFRYEYPYWSDSACNFWFSSITYSKRSLRGTGILDLVQFRSSSPSAAKSQKRRKCRTR